MLNKRLCHGALFTLLIVLLSFSVISLTILSSLSSFINDMMTIAQREYQHKGYSFAALSTLTVHSRVNQTINQHISNSTESFSLPLSLTDIFKRIKNSVVQITSTISNPNEVITINGKRLSGNSTALGSGFIYDKKGHLVTNDHVVPDTSNTANKLVDVANKLYDYLRLYYHYTDYQPSCLQVNIIFFVFITTKHSKLCHCYV